MRRLAPICLVLSGCAGLDEGKLSRLAQVTANPELHGQGGSVWALLYPPAQGFPGPPAAPVTASAASAVRVATGDAHVVLPGIEPNLYRLWGFLDVDGNFDPQIDVLAQPGAGDRVGSGVEINVQPGRDQQFGLDIAEGLTDEPPAFHLEDEVTDVTLAETSALPTPLTLVADALDGTFDGKHVGFRVGLIDDDGNNVPDDLDGDGAPDLWPRAFMRWVPRPGQGAPNTEVLLPMVFNPAPFLAELAGDLTRSLVVNRLQFGVLSQGQKITTAQNGKVTTELLTSAPVGEYQLVLYTRTGQYWRIPNDLGPGRPPQAVSFHVDRNGR
jgi:hypothetical protein